MDEAALNAAKEEAISDDTDLETVEEEAVEEDVEEVIEEEVEEVVTQEHKENSKLGRKVAALLSKSDKTDRILDRMQQTLELIGNKGEPDPVEEEYITKGEMNALLNKQKEVSTKFETDFKQAFHTLSENMDEEKKEAIGMILLENYNENMTNNGFMDGTTAFRKAKRHYEKSIKKEIPLKSKKAIGVIKNQKSKKIVKSIDKVDKQSESYYNYVRNTRGNEAEENLRKKMK